ncbi:hypothetical protein F2P81_000735 [Scophthalmus maximus]|uniref:Uncharacterized protein n=1 Tax=Scophthalmus maximus TaxID=52904 RepID=A0A6A4TYK4_SCOMX|nr:hypothetical protein F2P81_000735 [Scophthalmus maximus]
MVNSLRKPFDHTLLCFEEYSIADSQLTVWYEPALSLQLPVTGSTSDLSCQILFTSPMLSQTPRGNQAQSRDVGAKRLINRYLFECSTFENQTIMKTFPAIKNLFAIEL